MNMEQAISFGAEFKKNFMYQMPQPKIIENI